MMKPVLTTAIALTALLGVGAAGMDSAMARDGRNGAFAAGAAAGVIGGAVLGGALNRPYDDETTTYRRPVYSESRCHYERREVTDSYGDTTVQRVRVCVRPGY